MSASMKDHFVATLLCSTHRLFPAVSCAGIWMTALLLPSCLFAQAVQHSFTLDLEIKLANFFEVNRTNETIDDRVANALAANEATQEVVVEEHDVEKFASHVAPSAVPPIAHPLVLFAVANSHLILSGTPVESRSLPITDRTFLFTEYKVRVDRVFFDKSNAIHAGDTIVVSREGGSLEIGNVTLQAKETAFDQFPLDRPCIFGLFEIPGTGSFRATAPTTFTISDGIVSSASKLEAKTGPRQTLESFTADLQGAVADRLRKRGNR